jgi:hypothetical protein
MADNNTESDQSLNIPTQQSERGDYKNSISYKHSTLGTIFGAIVLVGIILFPAEFRAFGGWLQTPLHMVSFIITGSLAGMIVWHFL